MSQRTRFEVSTQRAYRSLLGILTIAFIFVSFSDAARTHRFWLNQNSQSTLSSSHIDPLARQPLLRRNAAPAAFAQFVPSVWAGRSERRIRFPLASRPYRP